MKAVQYHPDFCAEAKLDMETNGWKPFTKWDSSHDLSLILDDGSRHYVGRYRSADAAQAAGEEIEKMGIIPVTTKED